MARARGWWPWNRRSAVTPGALAGPSPRFRQDLQRLVRLLRYMRPYRRRFILGIVTGVLYGTVTGYFPKGVERVFHLLFESGSEPSLGLALVTCLGVPLYFVLRGAIGFVNAYSLSWVGNRMLHDIRVELFDHLQRLSMNFFVRERVAALIQIVNNNTQAMQASLVVLAGDIIKQPVTIVAAIVVLAYINVYFCLFGIGLAAVSLIPMVMIGRRVRQASNSEENSAGDLLGILHESFSNVRVIKAYLLERLQQNQFRLAARQQMRLSLRFQRHQELLAPLIEIIGSLAISAALLFVFFSRIEVSQFLGVIAGFYMMYDPLKRIGRLHVQTQRILTVAERVFGVLDAEPETLERDGTVELDGFHDAIRYRGVSLEYVPSRRALDGIDLTIPRGSVCALVGPSGAGKTSIVNLLLRFYDPTAGSVTLDGQDLREVRIRSLRGLIGLVSQETIMFSDTVAANIGYGRPGATREEIVTAARQAQAHDFIMAMPAQYETVLTDRGQNLSGGQCQRISIARAFLKNPAILVLDEATSALDAESERQVREAMARLMQGRTTLVIAHRLSTVRHADQFVVLDHGRVVEIGNHDELLERGGLYRRLYELQIV